MNSITHLKYAVEVAKTGSISKAAENLYMGQPHLSKAIRELEDSVGIAIFARTSKGVVPTKKGAEFLVYAQNILAQVEELEALYKPAHNHSHRFSISVPRADYIASTFAAFASLLDEDAQMDLNYHETSTMYALKNIMENSTNVAIIRYQEQHEKYIMRALVERELECEVLASFREQVVMSEKHPLAQTPDLQESSLLKYAEVTYIDSFIPSLPLTEARRIAKAEERKKKIAVYERASMLEILQKVPTSYAWTSPISSDTLSSAYLVTRPCERAGGITRDLLVFRRGESRTKEEDLFLMMLTDKVKAPFFK